MSERSPSPDRRVTFSAPRQTKTLRGIGAAYFRGIASRYTTANSRSGSVHVSAMRKPPLLGERVDAGGVVLVGIFGVDPLAFDEVEAPARHRHRLIAQAAEVDLDPALDRIVERLVREAARSNVACSSRFMRRSRFSVKAAVTPAEVVVGVVQALRILLEIDAEHQRAVVAQQLSRAFRRKAVASAGSRLPMVEPGKNPSRRAA